MQLKQNLRFPLKNPVYGRHWISWPMRIVGQIQFWEVTQFAFKKKKKKRFYFERSQDFFLLFCFLWRSNYFFFEGGGQMRPGTDHGTWGTMRGLKNNGRLLWSTGTSFAPHHHHHHHQFPTMIYFVISSYKSVLMTKSYICNYFIGQEDTQGQTSRKCRFEWKGMTFDLGVFIW